jgi:hypothetical protein
MLGAVILSVVMPNVVWPSTEFITMIPFDYVKWQRLAQIKVSSFYYLQKDTNC